MQILYGYVLSDMATQITGSVGLAGSANIGKECPMFEAIHGSAPKRTGQNVANTSGLLQGAIMMLNHFGQTEIAEKINMLGSKDWKMAYMFTTFIWKGKLRND